MRTWPYVVAPFVVIGTLTLVVLFGVGAFESKPPLPPELPSDPCPRGADVQLPNQLSQVAAPYTGPGPHLVHVVGLSKDTAGVWTGGEAERGITPLEWRPPYPRDENHGKVQLVVCEYRESTGQAVETCEYIGGSTRTLVTATYTYRVYAARTAELVTTFELTGSSGCPDDIVVWNDQNTHGSVPQDVSSTAFANALRPIVEGTV